MSEVKDITLSKNARELMNTLPADLRAPFEELYLDYAMACLKHHGKIFGFPVVFAELIKNGWRKEKAK